MMYCYETAAGLINLLVIEWRGDILLLHGE